MLVDDSGADHVKGLKLYHFLMRMWPLVSKYRMYAVVICATMILSAVVSRLLPTIIGMVIDQGILKKDMAIIAQLVVAYFVIEIGKSLFLFANQFYFKKLGNKILFDLRHMLIEHVQNLPMSYFHRHSSGRIVTRLTNDILGLGELFNQGLSSLLINFIELVSILIALCLISTQLTLISLVTAPIVTWALVKLSKRIMTILRESKSKLSLINSFVAENLNGIRILHLFHRVGTNRSLFGDLSRSYRKTQVNAVKSYAILWPTLSAFSGTTITLGLYFGGVFQDNLGLQIGSLVAFLVHIQDIQPPLRQILERFVELQNSLTSAERIFSLLDEKSELENVNVISASPAHRQG